MESTSTPGHTLRPTTLTFDDDGSDMSTSVGVSSSRSVSSNGSNEIRSNTTTTSTSSATADVTRSRDDGAKNAPAKQSLNMLSRWTSKLTRRDGIRTAGLFVGVVVAGALLFWLRRKRRRVAFQQSLIDLVSMAFSS
jgi:hypothetical protein